ncbi:MAG TPA: DUF4153 domain-containing protein [Bacteroidia bacterium]|nr:DUF4153 domain-containing protein [Bacteroidia bacterium]
MKFPSLQSLFERATVTLARFPLTLASAITSAVLVIILINNQADPKDPDFYSIINGVMVCSIGLTLFTALSLFSESRNHTFSIRVLLQALGFCLLTWYYYVLPDATYTRYDMLRFMIYNYSGHLLVAFLPYVGRPEPEGFWSYNKGLFIQFLTSVLYSAVLYGGLAIALLAIDNLFEVHVDEKNYFRLYVIIAAVFNTWFFLSGIPERFRHYQEQSQYPRGLKIFTQYVLLPIITLYMLILYSYMFKIIVSGVWPEGWVSWLVLSFSVAGILALLLVWPVRNDSGNRWMRIYANGFYVALFPLVILLFLSIRIRVIEYGMTEGRYYVVLLALWLAGIATYFLFSKAKSIKIIPLTLFIIGILSVHGPWSAFTVSKNSQLNLLKNYLAKNGMIKDGKAVAAVGDINRKDHVEIVEKIEYLTEVHGYGSLQELFSQPLDSIMHRDPGERQVNADDRLLALLNLSHINAYDLKNSIDKHDFYFYCSDDEVFPVSGYDFEKRLEFYDNRNKYPATRSFDVAEIPVTASWDMEKGIFSVATPSTKIDLDVVAKISEIYRMQPGEFNRHTIPVSELIIEKQTSGLKVKILIVSASGNYLFKTKRFEVSDLKINCLIRFN